MHLTLLRYNKITFKSFFLAARLPGLLLIGRNILLILVQRGRTIDQTTTVDASAGIQIVYTLICFLVAINFFIRDGLARELLVKTPLKILFSFHVFALISMIWSVNASMTFFRAFEAITYGLLILTTFSQLHKKYSLDEIFRWLVFYAFYAIIISAIGRARLWGVGFFSIDSLMSEQFNSTPFFFLALLLPMVTIPKYFIIIISIFSFSNTAYLGMFLGSFALGKGSKWIKIIFFLFVFILGFVLLLFDVEIILQNTLFYGKEGVGLEYTTGRDKVWTYALEVISEKPFTGYGFVSGEIFKIFSEYEGAIGAHNGLVSAIIGCGVFGGILFVLFFINVLAFVFRAKVFSKLKAAFLATLILITIHTLGNPGIGSRVYGTWMPAMVAITFIVGFTYVLKRNYQYENNLGHP